MGIVVRSTGYKVLHRPVEPAGVIGMWPEAGAEDGCAAIEPEEVFCGLPSFAV